MANNQDKDFNFEALSKAYETGTLRKEDFVTDEDWSLAMDIFLEQTTEEIELEGLIRVHEESSFGFEDFKSLHPDFNWDDDYTELGFPDGQFRANGLDKIESAFLAECWRSQLTEHAHDFIFGINDVELKHKIHNIYDRCDSIDGNRTDFNFPWDNARIEPDNGGDIWCDGTY